MPTLRQIARDMIARSPTAIGRTETITSLTTVTAVCASLAFGGTSSQRFVDKWMLRRDTASSADRLRRCTAFASATGTLTHAGTNYADTTATGESLEILEFEPYIIDNAIQTTLGRLRRVDRYLIPARAGWQRYSLADLSWIKQPGDILGVYESAFPVLGNNPDMEKWNSVTTGGALQPDDWTTTQSIVMARSTTQTLPGDGYAVSLTRAGVDGLFTQSLGLLETGVSSDSLRSTIVTVVAEVWSSTASQVRCFVDDSGTPQYGSYHTGGSGWEEITKQVTVSATATKLDFGVTANGSNNVCYVRRCYLCYGPVQDSMRHGRPQSRRMSKDEYSFDQGRNQILLPPGAKGSSFEIYSGRPYPQFDSARFTAGTADGDTTDAPLEIVSTGAIARMFEGLAEQESNTDTRARYAGIAKEWGRRYEQLALGHLGIEPLNGVGVDWPLPRVSMPVRRI